MKKSWIIALGALLPALAQAQMPALSPVPVPAGNTPKFYPLTAARVFQHNTASRHMPRADTLDAQQALANRTARAMPLPNTTSRFVLPQTGASAPMVPVPPAVPIANAAPITGSLPARDLLDILAPQPSTR